MEGVSATVCKGIKSYWNRRGYHRLTGAPSCRRISRAKLGNSTRKRRFWKIKITRRLKLKLKLKLRFNISPKKFFIGLRDAYVKMMMRMANTSVVHSGRNGAGMNRGNAINEFGLRPVKEYDEKMIIEIYKTLVVAHGLVPRDQAKITAQISCAR